MGVNIRQLRLIYCNGYVHNENAENAIDVLKAKIAIVIKTLAHSQDKEIATIALEEASQAFVTIKEEYQNSKKRIVFSFTLDYLCAIIISLATLLAATCLVGCVLFCAPASPFLICVLVECMLLVESIVCLGLTVYNASIAHINTRFLCNKQFTEIENSLNFLETCLPLVQEADQPALNLPEEYNSGELDDLDVTKGAYRSL